jgi:hypothetical protein
MKALFTQTLGLKIKSSRVTSSILFRSNKYEDVWLPAGTKSKILLTKVTKRNTAQSSDVPMGLINTES